MTRINENNPVTAPTVPAAVPPASAGCRRLRVVFAGTPDFAVPALQAVAHVAEIVGVLTAPDAVVGRGRQPTAPAVKVAAASAAWPVFQPTRLGAAARAQVAAWGGDLLVCVAYGRLFGPRFLGLFPYGGINVHPSLLPRWRGPSPLVATILAGDSVAGVSVQRLAAGMDSGDVLARRALPLQGRETAADLQAWAAEAGAGLLPVVLQRIAADDYAMATTDASRAEVQDEKAATYCRLVQKTDGAVTWLEDAQTIDRMVRAYTPWPGVYARYHGRRLLFLSGSPRADAAPAPSPPPPGREPPPATPGTVLCIDKRAGVLVQTRQGIYVVDHLQLETKKAMPWQAFVNGNPEFVGSVLEPA